MRDYNDLLSLLKRYWDLVDWCISAPYTAPVCKPFWMTVSMTSLSLGILGLLWLAWKLFQRKRQYDAAIYAQIASEQIAEPDVMEKAKWSGDVVPEVAAITPDDVLADQIRESLARRKLGLDTPGPVQPKSP